MTAAENVTQTLLQERADKYGVVRIDEFDLIESSHPEKQAELTAAWITHCGYIVDGNFVLTRTSSVNDYAAAVLSMDGSPLSTQEIVDRFVFDRSPRSLGQRAERGRPFRARRSRPMGPQGVGSRRLRRDPVGHPGAGRPWRWSGQADGSRRVHHQPVQRQRQQRGGVRRRRSVRDEGRDRPARDRGPGCAQGPGAHSPTVPPPRRLGLPGADQHRPPARQRLSRAARHRDRSRPPRRRDPAARQPARTAVRCLDGTAAPVRHHPPLPHGRGRRCRR